MKINYTIGRAGTGKSNRLRENIKTDLENSDLENIIILVPEQYTLDVEYEIINKLNLKGILSVEVLSFKRLSKKILEKSRGNVKSIDEIGKYMLLNKIIDKNYRKMKIFKNTRKQGLLSEVLSMINILAQNKYTAETMEDKLKLIDENILKMKLEDIILIYSEYENGLEKGILDEKDIHSILLEEIEKSEFLKETNIYIDNFTGFTKQEYEIIERLTIKANSMNIALTLDKSIGEGDIFAPTRETYSILKDMEQRNNIESEEIVLTDGSNKSKEIRIIEKHFNKVHSEEHLEEPVNIDILVGMNRQEEIEKVAIELVRLVREEKTRWRDIVVATNDIETYQSIIKIVFSQYEIPYYLDESRDLIRHGLIRFILSALRTVSDNFRYKDVFNTLKTGYSSLTGDEVEILENYVLRTNLKGKKWFDEIELINLDSLPEEDRADYISEMETIEGIRKKYIEEVEVFYKNTRKKITVENLNKELFEFLLKNAVWEKTKSIIDYQKARGELDLANELTQVWNNLVDVLDQMSSILGEKKLKVDEYIEILEAGLLNYEIGLIPPTLDQVQVRSIDRIYALDISTSFLIGLNDGVLPSIMKEEGLLSDEEKLHLKEIDIDIKTDYGRKLDNEEFLIYLNLTKPNERIYLSYATLDSEGAALNPSKIIERVVELFPNVRIDGEESIKMPEHFINTQASTMTYLIEYLRENLNTEKLDKRWIDVLDWYYNNSAEDIDTISESLFSTNQKERIEREYVKKLYNLPLKGSSSRVTKYINCPFNHFVDYGLRPVERKQYVIEAPDVGNILHDIMEISLEKIKDKDMSEIEIDEIKTLVDSSIAMMMERPRNNIYLSTKRYEYLIEKIRDRSIKTVEVAVNHLKKGTFKMRDFELSFGEDGDLAAKKIELDESIEGLDDEDLNIQIRGRIDRVDVAKDIDTSYIKLIDYKSGNVDFSLSDVYNGLDVQLVIYMDVLLNSEYLKRENENVKLAGIFYYKIQNPMVEHLQGKDLKKDLLEQFKLEGMVIDEEKAIRYLEKDFYEAKDSSILPIKLKKDGNFGKRSSIISKEDSDYLMKNVEDTIKSVGKEILQGNVKIEPYKNKNRTACTYCKLRGICRFDPILKDNKYKNLNKYSDEEVLSKIRKKYKKESEDK